MKPSDYERFKGRDVEVKLYTAIDGRKELAGRLLGRTDERVTVEVEGREVVIPADKIAKINLAVIF